MAKLANKTGRQIPELSSHHGQNIKRIRILLGMSQKEVAAVIGGGWTQKRISRIECSPKVQLRFREQLAKAFDIEVAFINEFDQAAGRMAINHIMKFGKLIPNRDALENQTLLQDITDLLESASFAIHRERQNMQLLLRLLLQSRQNVERWNAHNNTCDNQEVREAPVVNWRVA